MKTIFFILIFTQSVLATSLIYSRLYDKIQSLPEDSKLRMNLQQVLDSCNQAQNLVAINVKKNSSAISSFKYYYEFERINESLPTVVFLPGGPGGFSIGSSLSIKNANLIKIDPRGTGCNWGDSSFFNPMEVSTATAAEDVIEIIKSEKIKRVILYGQSYGTVLAMHIAKKLEQMKSPPELIVLEGTLGKSWGDWRNYLKSFVNIGNDFLSENTNIKSALSQTQLPLNLSSQFWAWKISFSGNYWDETIQTFKVLLDESSSEYENTKQEILVNYQYFNSRPLPDLRDNPSFFVTQSILCSELSNSYKSIWPIDLLNGNLNFLDSDYNKAMEYCPSDSNFIGYDSANFQLNSTIVYFQGTADPQTPIGNALYHFQSQNFKKNKYFYEIQYAGHSPLTQPLLECSDKVWGNLLSRHYHLETILDSSGHCK